MSTRADLLEWLKTTKVDFPGLDGPGTDGKRVRFSKYLNGTYVVTRGTEEIYRGEEQDKALDAWHAARGFPSGDPNQPR